MIISLVFVAWIAAQTVPATGEVRGRVVDQEGLSVAGAAVFLINPSSSAARLTLTKNAGTFTFTGVAPGAYNVRAQLDGFTSAERDGLQVTAGMVTEVVLTLTVRPYGETVVVTGSRKEELVRFAPA